jgi:amino acid permease
MYAVVLAASAAVVCKATPLRAIVNVADVAAVFVTAMFVTTVVVPAGTVYNVVLDVAAAVRAITFVTVAISYYLFL